MQRSVSPLNSSKYILLNLFGISWKPLFLDGSVCQPISSDITTAFEWMSYISRFSVFFCKIISVWGEYQVPVCSVNIVHSYNVCSQLIQTALKWQIMSPISRMILMPGFEIRRLKLANENDKWSYILIEVDAAARQTSALKIHSIKPICVNTQRVRSKTKTVLSVWIIIITYFDWVGRSS